MLFIPSIMETDQAAFVMWTDVLIKPSGR